VVSAVGTVIAPASVDEVSDVLRGAAKQSVLIAGAGTKEHWGGSPSRVDIRLETRRLAGVTAHDPGDLVVTVRAGTRLSDLQAVLGLARQRLALESPSPQATVGGVLAAGEAGPSRLRFGSGRDQLIGAEFVRADGVIAHSGGRVVKNVAGYDIGRLLCGSYGTLAVLTSATFRLHPLPAERAFVCCPIEPAAKAAAHRSLSPDQEYAASVAAALAPAVNPTAVEIDVRDGVGTLAVLIEGSREGVQARAAEAARALGGTVTEEPEWWGRYPFGADEIALRLALPVSKVGRILRTLGHAGAIAVRGSAGSGVLHAALPQQTSTDDLNGLLEQVRAELATFSVAGAPGGSCVVLAAPPAVRDAVDLWGPVPGLALMRRVKQRFDPRRRFVAGRFVGGL
jgi:glycolate oxidase FAD binding subunit